MQLQNTSAERGKIVTEFSSEMFNEVQSSPAIMQEMDYYHHNSASSSMSYTTQNLTRGNPVHMLLCLKLHINKLFTANIEARLEDIKLEVAMLKARRQEKMFEIDNMENLALRQRFQDILGDLLQELLEKQHEQEALQDALQELIRQGP